MTYNWGVVRELMAHPYCTHQSSSEKQSQYKSLYFQIYCKELAHVIKEAESPKICSQQAGDPGELMVQFQSGIQQVETQKRWGKIDASAQRWSNGQSSLSLCHSVLFRPSTDGMGPAHIGKAILLLSLLIQMLIIS